MSPSLIEYNTVFEVVRENEKWFLSERKNKKDFPVFDLEKGSWCSIDTSKNKQWFILFYSSKGTGVSKFYKSFTKFDSSRSTFKFTRFTEVTRGLNGVWNEVKDVVLTNQLGK